MGTRGARTMRASRIMSWVFTVPLLLTIGLLLVAFDLLQRTARAFGARPHEIVVGALQRSILWSLRICRTRIRVERSPQIQPHTGYLIVSNPQATFRIPLIC